MDFFTEEQLASFRIEKMIFHVVGKDPSCPLVLDQIVEVGAHDDFFRKRILDTLRGAKYQFLEISGIRTALIRAATDEMNFVNESINLAKRFQSLYSGDHRLSNGVLLLLQIRAMDEIVFDIIKFDHDPAVGYRFREENGHRTAILSEISSHFSKHKESMQKSALIRPNGNNSMVCAIDRSSRIDITSPFQQFLDVRRALSHKELTSRMYEAICKVGMQHKDHLDREIAKNLKMRAHAALVKLGAYAPDQADILKAAVFGALPEDNPIHRAFEAELKRRHIADEPIEFDPQVLPPPRRFIKETEEGVRISIPESALDRVAEVPLPSGERCIQIRTARLKVDDVETEGSSRRTR